MPEENLYVRNAANNKFILTNRFQLFTRVAQYWLCDCVSRSIENRLEWWWIRNNQNYISNSADPTIQQLQTQNSVLGTMSLIPDDIRDNVPNTGRY